MNRHADVLLYNGFSLKQMVRFSGNRELMIRRKYAPIVAKVFGIFYILWPTKERAAAVFDFRPGRKCK